MWSLPQAYRLRLGKGFLRIGPDHPHFEHFEWLAHQLDLGKSRPLRLTLERLEGLGKSRFLRQVDLGKSRPLRLTLERLEGLGKSRLLRQEGLRYPRLELLELAVD